MKRIIILIILCIITICSYAQINVSKADALIESQILSNPDYSDCWIFRYDANANIQLIYNKTITLQNDVFAYVVSRKPEQAWIDGYEYYFVSKNNGSISKQTYTYCPETFDNWIRIYGKDLVSGNKTYNFESETAKTRRKLMIPSNRGNQTHKYAVIISGGFNKQNNHIRYWNDCSTIYKVLKNYYGYKDSDIYVLISDGQSYSEDRNINSDPTNPRYDSSPWDLDGDGICDIDYSATKSNISNVFNQLANKVTSEDNLFVFTTDHGEYGPYLCLWNKEIMNDTEFTNEIDKVNANHISVLMLQCYSGGFINKLAKKNRVIMTAASGYEQSNGSFYFNLECFLMPWIAAVTGFDINNNIVNADANNDGKISMYEAFVYARDHDSMAISGNEHPQYCSVNEHLGEYLTLNGCDCEPIYVENRTITSNLTITGCIVNVSNVTIQNNSIVTIDAGESATLNGPFEVKLGSTLEIK